MAQSRTIYKDVLSLTEGEARCMDVLMQTSGDVAEAAEVMGLSRKSLHNRFQTVREKLGAKTSQEAIEIWRAR